MSRITTISSSAAPRAAAPRAVTRIAAANRLPTLLLACVLLACALLAAGCAQKAVIATTPAPRAEGPDSFLSRADAAWAAGDTTRSEAAYGKLLGHPGLTEPQLARARRRFVESALKNRHHHLALDELVKWLARDPAARKNDFTRQAFFEAARAIGRTPETTARLDAVYNDASYPASWRSEAGLALAGYAWNRGDVDGALALFRELWRQNDDATYRSFLEKGLLTEAARMGDADLEALAARAPADAAPSFPFTVIELERARRLGQDEATWPRAWQMLRRLLQEGGMADKDLVSSVLMPLEAERGQPVQGMALLLPLSGPYGGVGWKILRGAGVAQWNLAQAGIDLKVRVLNTAAPGWETELADLPEGFVVTGGPLRRESFEAVRGRGLDKGRILFCFLPSLGNAVEGADAWRFFASPRDQVRTLLRVAVDDLELSDVAALYPDEPYGRRMTQLFAQEIAATNATLGPTVAYPPKDHTAWGKIVADMLGMKPAPDGQDPIPPEPPFQAVFLPDTWAKAQMFVPQFLFNLEERQLFLGSSLWGQSVGGLDSLDARNFRLAVFPSAWWKENDSPAAEELRASLADEGLGEPDYWVALGFDFLRMASLLGPLPRGWNSTLVNERLAFAQHMPWSMAPMAWDAHGVATQSLFVFTPSTNGAERVSPEQLRMRRDQLVRLHERRVEALTRKLEEQQGRTPKQQPAGGRQ
ncbi:MAG: penicillin-binding protein activator [Desulfovibrionaceae bacterium]|jgi:ABC-type branched-subunit amino acid transport system substrate-binding protein|nr:penicillin-binding protein activator [Desulfovibrionaceae bacterium]